MCVELLFGYYFFASNNVLIVLFNFFSNKTNIDRYCMEQLDLKALKCCLAFGKNLNLHSD